MRSLRVAASLVIAMAAVLSSPGPAGAGPEDVGAWSGPKNLGIVGTHAALLHTGKVLFYSGVEGESPGSVARLYDPVTGSIEKVDIPFEHEAFCSGVSAMPDGRVLVAGGNQDGFLGIRSVAIFDPLTETWARAANLARARYYPSVIATPDGRTIAVAGTNQDGFDVKRLEAYDPASDSWKTLPPSASQESGTYPRLALLPDGRIARVGEDRLTRVLDPATMRWSDLAQMRYGSRTSGGAVLLPGLQRVLAAGGSNFVLSTATAEILDLSLPTPAWKYTGSMRKARSNLNLVLLADGTVLAVGGGLVPPYGTPAKQAELFDPSTGQWKLMAAQQVQRTYHSTALLLPDGRVISAGSDFGFQAETFEVYSPPYLFKGPRPTIESAPASLAYGQGFSIATPDAADISRVALVRPGTTTHANDFDQRYVDLDFSAGIGAVDATAPAAAAEAPPGHYMLVILNSAGVPSIATFVHLA